MKTDSYWRARAARSAAGTAAFLDEVAAEGDGEKFVCDCCGATLLVKFAGQHRDRHYDRRRVSDDQHDDEIAKQDEWGNQEYHRQSATRRGE
jgi:hypothetical protein